jgi:mxaA protein
MLRSLLVFLACFSPVASAAADEVGTIRFGIVRKFGYLIGDIVPYDAVVTVDPSWTLRTSSLPSPGRPEYWLELRSVRFDELRAKSAHVYRIHLQYQVFYAPIEARTRDMPGFTLTFEHQGTSSDIRVPALKITMSPLREVATGTGDPEANIALARDRAPPALSLVRPAAGAAVAGAVSLCLYLLIAWQRAAWPFVVRRLRPFARAARALRSNVAEDPKSYAEALFAIHRAFDAAAGWRVFGDDQMRFIDQLPHYASAATEIGGFFAASRACFFSSNPIRASVECPPRALRALTRRLAALERGA